MRPRIEGDCFHVRDLSGERRFGCEGESLHSVAGHQQHRAAIISSEWTDDAERGVATDDFYFRAERTEEPAIELRDAAVTEAQHAGKFQVHARW